MDGDHLQEVLKLVDPETTVFIIVSKTFTTQETLTNAIKIKEFLKNKNADVICLQEYQNTNFNLDNYEYKYEKLRGDNLKYGQAIFSKYPIVLFSAPVNAPFS